MEVLPFLDMVLRYAAMPLLAWNAYLHKIQVDHMTQIAVLKAEAEAREKARDEERKATSKQLDQIVNMLQAMSGRIDSIASKDR
jgi:hypothetical protein